MKKKVKLTADWNGHAKGTILLVDPATYKSMCADKACEDYEETDDAEKGISNKDFQAARKGILDEAEERASAAVEKTLKGMLSGESKMLHISVKDKSDDDPCFGYLPSQKSMKDLTPGEINYAFGRFAVDVKNARDNGMSENLRKCKERSEKMVTKAAGDGMTIGDSETGGFLIFSAATKLIQNASLENAVVRPRANKVTMGTQLLRIPYLRDTDHSTGTVYQGIRVFFDDENAESTASKTKMEMLEFKLKKMTAMGYASEEWMKWSPVSLGSWLIPKFGEAIGWKEDLCFMEAKGGSQPLGLLNAPGKITVDRVANQTAATFVVENSTAMFARVKRGKAGSLVWLMNESTFPQLPMFNIAAGTGGAPVFTNNVGDAPGQKLWGIPIQYSEKVPTLGTAGAVILTDLSDYCIADDQTGPEIAQSIHLKFDYGQTAFRIVKYIDGLNETAVAFTPRYGSTRHPVVILAA